MRFTSIKDGSGCGCCEPTTRYPCDPCDIPKTDLTLTIVGDPACAISCNQPNQTITLTYDGVFTWQGLSNATQTVGGVTTNITLCFTLTCEAGHIRFTWSFLCSDDPPLCTMNAANAASVSCDPFVLHWVAPINPSGGTSPYICGCCITSLTITG